VITKKVTELRGFPRINAARSDNAAPFHVNTRFFTAKSNKYAARSVNAVKLRVTFSTLWLELNDHRITRMKANEGGLFR
jgi:hypothetical protein